MEFIPHFTLRDLNTMGIQSRLVGYWANHLRNVLLITGDPPKMSPTYPQSSAVFDLDSVALIHYVHGHLNRGFDFGGSPLGKQADPRTHFTIGTGFEPEAVDQDRELSRLERKLEFGADYVMTQPVFRLEPLNQLISFRAQTPILVGVMIATSLEHARRIHQVPGVEVPQEVFDRLAAHDQLEDQARVGRELAAEQIRWIKKEGWSGLYLMSPSSHEPVIEVLEMAQ